MKKGKAPIGVDGKPMEIHHKRPLSEGGTNAIENLEIKTQTDHRIGGNFRKNHPKELK
jgi:5-methylcytosine-specific restriction endonuclease McrA